MTRRSFRYVCTQLGLHMCVVGKNFGKELRFMGSAVTLVVFSYIVGLYRPNDDDI